MQFVKLCSRTWSTTALALIADGVAARISPLAHAAGCGRTSMTTSVLHLVELGLLQRSPRHGHPLRPEFVLSDQGQEIARKLAELFRSVPQGNALVLLRRNWTLTVLAALTQPRRFSELRSTLAPVTDKALSQTLADLTNIGWANRKVDQSSSPPGVSYFSKGQGKELSRMVSQIVDVGAG